MQSIIVTVTSNSGHLRYMVLTMNGQVELDNLSSRMSSYDRVAAHPLADRRNVPHSSMTTWK